MYPGRVGDAFAKEYEVLYGLCGSTWRLKTLVHVSLVREVDVCPVLSMWELRVEIAGPTVELRDNVGLIEEEGQPRQ